MKIIRINTFFNIGFHVCLPGLLIFINSLPLYAHDLPAEHEHEHELFFDMPIVLSANRLEQPASSAGASITMIDRETIIASGARTIPEILRLVPGMQVGFSGNEFGDEPQYVVTYHGHSDQYSRQMQVLIDGRSIYEPFRGGVNWKSIPVNINDIERIEVSRGPNMATYGTNSFQAAINIITRTAAEDQGSFIQTNIGSDDIRDITYRYGGSSGNLDYRITAATLNDAGLDSANQYDYPDDTQSNNIDYRLDYQLNNNNTISYQGGYGKNHQQTDRNHSGEYPLARTVENTRIFQFVKWESVINQKNTVLLQYYYNLSDKKDSSLVDIPPPFDPFTLDGDIRTERHNFEFTHFFTPDENFRFLWGASTQLDVALAPLYLGTADKVKNNQLRGFANIEWHLDQQNIINAGALVENNDYTPTDLSPRLSLTHVFNEHHSVRIGISQAIRNPFIFEGDADTFINQELTVNTNPAGIIYTDQIYLGSIPANIDLQNEKITSYEIAYYGRFIDSNLLFNARFSHDEITNFIRATNHMYS